MHTSEAWLDVRCSLKECAVKLLHTIRRTVAVSTIDAIMPTGSAATSADSSNAVKIPAFGMILVR